MICSFENCNLEGIKRGLCGTHYHRLRRHGLLPPKQPMMRPRQGEAFLLNALQQETDDCIDWPFGLNPGGYGQVKFEGRQEVTNRAMCILAHGPPPFPDAVAAHSCARNRKCVNKRHLSWKTPRGNSQDMIAHGTSLRGEQNSMSSFTEAQVLKIVKDSRRLVDIAADYQCSIAAISFIKTGRTWGWLTGIQRRAA